MAKKPSKPAPVDREPVPTPAPPPPDFVIVPSAEDIREVEIAASITIAVLSSPRIVEECLKSKTEHTHDLARGVAAYARTAAVELVKPLRGGGQ